MSTNAPELRRVMAHIEANQRHWDQSWWRTFQEDEAGNICGTAFCFAGWKCELDGVKWKYHDGEGFSDVIILPDGKETCASTYAMDAFGLDYAEGRELFAPDNTLDDLRAIVAELCAEAEGEA